MSRPDDLDILEADVRASAPRMSPELEARLEAIVARPERRLAWVRPAAGALAFAAAAAVVVVVAIGRHSDHRSAELVAPRQEQSAGSAAATAAPVAPQARRVEQDASLTLAAPSRAFGDVTDRVMATTDRFGGIVQRSSVDQQGAGGTASFDLRIPARRLEDALAALSRLAHVRSRSAGTVDVTGAYNGAAARLAEARAERRALLRALARATTTAEIASVRARLRDNGQRIERAQRTVARLRARTDLARVDVTVVATRPRGGGGGGGGSDHHWTPGDAARTALRVLEVVLGVILVALAVLLPVAVLGGLGAAGTRAARRRRREAALSA